MSILDENLDEKFNRIIFEEQWRKINRFMYKKLPSSIYEYYYDVEKELRNPYSRYEIIKENGKEVKIRTKIWGSEDIYAIHDIQFIDGVYMIIPRCDLPIVFINHIDWLLDKDISYGLEKGIFPSYMVFAPGTKIRIINIQYNSLKNILNITI